MAATLSLAMAAGLAPAAPARATIRETETAPETPAGGDADDTAHDGRDESAAGVGDVPGSTADQGDAEESGQAGDADEGRADSRTEAPQLAGIWLGDVALFERRADGTLDEHAEVTLVGGGELRVTASDADGDLALGGAEASHVEVRGPGGKDPIACGFRLDGSGTDYALDADGGTVFLSQSGAYDITVVLSDGDPAHKVTYSRQVTVDLKEPEVTLVFGDERPGSEGGQVFASRTAAVQVIDDLAVVGEPSVTVEGGDLTVSGWERSDDGRRTWATLTFGEGSFSDLRVEATDGIHHVVTSDLIEHEFVVDVTPPVIAEATLAGGVDLNGARSEDPVLASDATVTVRVDDGHPEILEVTCDDGDSLPVADGGDGRYTFELPEGGCPGLRLVARDAAGNESEAVVVEAGSVVVDTTAPTIDAVTTSADGAPALVDGARLGIGRDVLTLTVSDVNLPEGASGVRAEATWADGGSTVRLDAYEVVRTDSRATYALALPDGAYSGLAITVVDRAGNVSKTASFADLLVDTVAPQVGITDVTEGLRRGLAWSDGGFDYLLRERAAGELSLYLKVPVRSVVTVDDPNLCEADSCLEVDGLVVPFPDGETVSWGDTQQASEALTLAWEREGSHHTCTVTYGDQGSSPHAAPSVVACDLAGNTTQAGERTPFAVDATPPAIELAWGQGDAPDPAPANVEGGRAYYDSPRTVTVSAEDANWDPDQELGDVVHVTDLDASATPRSDYDLVPSGSSGLSGASCVAIFRDGAYHLDVGAHDLAGNRTEASEVPDFVVDTTPPAIGVSFDGGPAHNGRYYGTARTMTVTVDERNFDPTRIQVVVSTARSDHDGDPVGDVNDPSRWESAGDRHTFSYRFDRDGAYTVAVQGSDLAGNEAQPVAVDEFVIDRTPPEVSVAPSRAADVTRGGVGYYRAPVAWDVTIRDRNLDVAGADASVAEVVRGRTGAMRPVRDWERSEAEDGTVTWHATVVFDELVGSEVGLASQSPRVRAVDLASNESAAAPRPFYVDRTAPSIVTAEVSHEPSATGEGQGYQFFNLPTSMTFAFHDPYGLATALLDDPDGEYVVRGGVTPGSTDGHLTIGLVDGTQRSHDTKYERNVTLTVTDIAGNVRAWTIDRQGTVVDDSGSSPANTSLNGWGIHPLSLVEDVTAPLVELTGVTEGAFYGSPQTFHLSVDEFNLAYLRRFDPARTVVRVRRRAADAGGSVERWDVPVSALVGTGAVWGLDQVLATDGHYELEAGFADFAGNLSNAVAIGEFTIDQTAPVVSVSWDNEDVRNGRYYDAPRTATVTVVEHDFDPSRMSLETTGTVGGWLGDGDAHTCTVSFGEGVHTLAVSGSDQAGNASNVVVEPEFVVDTTSPTIEFGGRAQRTGAAGEGAMTGSLEDHGAYNGIVAPELRLADEANLDGGSVSVSLTGGRLGDATDLFAHEASGDGNELTLRYDDLGKLPEGYATTYDAGADDVYVLHASVADLAGNTTEVDVTFSVNRFGSNYLVTVDGEELGEGTSPLTRPPTVRVREINVSGVASEAGHEVLKEHANATSPILREDEGEGPGYRLETLTGGDASNGFGWAEYLYTVRGANFGAGSDSDVGDGGQGVYRVNVTSDDAASNANTTASYWQSDVDRSSVREGRGTVEFTLDEDGPVIDAVDLPQGPSVGQRYEASFHVTDAITTGDEVEVTVDGERVDVRGPGDGRGTFTFTIPARSFASHHVHIAVRDYAGRTDDAEARGLYVTDLAAEAGLAGLALGSVGGVALLRRHRRRHGRPADVRDGG